MRLLDRYVLSIFLPALGVFAGVFVALYLAIDLAGNLQKFLEIKSLPVLSCIVRYYACRLPLFFSYLLPAVMVFAPMFTLVKLARNNEILPVAASGTSLRRLALPFLVAGVLAGAVMAVMDEFVLVHLAEEMSETEALTSGRETSYSAFARDERSIIDALRYNTATRTLTGVRVTWLDEKANTVLIVTADRVEWDPEGRRWLAFEGEAEWPREFVEVPDGRPRARKEVLPARGRPLETSITPKEFRKGTSITDRFGFAPLADLVEDARSHPGDGRRWSKVHARLSFPLSPLILLLLGLPMVITAHGRSFVKGLIFSFLLSLAFYMTYLGGQDLAGSGSLPHLLGGWGPTAVFAAAGAVAFSRLRT